MTTANVPTSPLLSQLEELLKNQRKNRIKIAGIILALIKEKPGGVNTKNCEEVFSQLTKAYHIPRITLGRYVEIAQNRKLPELFDYLGMTGDLAWSLEKKDQEKILYHGVPVWNSETNESLQKRLVQMSDEEVVRVIDVRNHRIRSVQQQREIKIGAKLVDRRFDKQMVRLWAAEGRYCAVKINRVSFVDLCYIVRQLKSAGIMVGGDADLKVREQVDALISRKKQEFSISLPQGKSQA